MAEVLERPEIVDFDDALSQLKTDQVAMAERLISELESAAKNPREADFRRVFVHAQTFFDLTNVQFAELLHVSRPTVSRWVNGQVAPHHVMARAIFADLLERTKKRVRDLKAARR